MKLKILCIFLFLLLIVHLPAQTPAVPLWSGNVKVQHSATIWNAPVTFNSCNITDSASIVHVFSKPSALCALAVAADLGGFAFTVTDIFGVLFVTAVDGVNNTAGNYWLYRVNGVSPVIPAGEFLLNDAAMSPLPPHTDVIWYFGSYSLKPLKLELNSTYIFADQYLRATVYYMNDTLFHWMPIEGAAVHAGSGAYFTDVNGVVLVPPLAAGSYIVYASKPGYLDSNLLIVYVSTITFQTSTVSSMVTTTASATATTTKVTTTSLITTTSSGVTVTATSTATLTTSSPVTETAVVTSTSTSVTYITTVLTSNTTSSNSTDWWDWSPWPDMDDFYVYLIATVVITACAAVIVAVYLRRHDTEVPAGVEEYEGFEEEPGGLVE